MATSQSKASVSRAASTEQSDYHAQAFENLAKKLYRLESRLGMLCYGDVCIYGHD